MEIVKPYAELWEPKDIESHIIRCGQLCYASERNISDKNRWLNDKWRSGHKSIFRHGTHYFAIPIIVCTEKMLNYFEYNPYIGLYKNNEFAFVSINEQTYREVKWFHHLFKYSTSELGLKGFIENEEDEQGILKILRRTVLVQTQISTSRELNRTSPNNICEQSTRFCNFTQEKFNGEVKLCQPHWLNILGDNGISCIFKIMDGHIMMYDENGKPYQTICSNHHFDIIVNIDLYKSFVYDYLYKAIEATECYNNAIHNEILAQDARGILPLDTNTRCVYTYRVEEWKHILDLRYYGTTGKPHPNAIIAANCIRKELNKSLPQYSDASWTDDYFPEAIIF